MCVSSLQSSVKIFKSEKIGLLQEFVNPISVPLVMASQLADIAEILAALSVHVLALTRSAGEKCTGYAERRQSRRKRLC
jgi:hypothetical protein